MSKRSAFVWLVVMFVAVAVAPMFAQGAETAKAAATSSPALVASIITAGFALGIAAGLGGIGQGKAIGSAAEAIARNPSAAGDIRGVLILGLVFIESLVIYVLFISITLMFIKSY